MTRDLASGVAAALTSDCRLSVGGSNKESALLRNFCADISQSTGKFVRPTP
jgi:hypothetical protein